MSSCLHILCICIRLLCLENEATIPPPLFGEEFVEPEEGEEEYVYDGPTDWDDITLKVSLVFCMSN